MTMSEWQPIRTAPYSDPLEQEWFLAYCPYDEWGILGNVHIACRYKLGDPCNVRVVGSNQDRYASHWMPCPEPPNADA